MIPSMPRSRNRESKAAAWCGNPEVVHEKVRFSNTNDHKAKIFFLRHFDRMWSVICCLRLRFKEKFVAIKGRKLVEYFRQLAQGIHEGPWAKRDWSNVATFASKETTSCSQTCTGKDEIESICIYLLICHWDEASIQFRMNQFLLPSTSQSEKVANGLNRKDSAPNGSNRKRRCPQRIIPQKMTPQTDHTAKDSAPTKRAILALATAQASLQPSTS
jgi:hypothetical protein